MKRWIKTGWLLLLSVMLVAAGGQRVYATETEQAAGTYGTGLILPETVPVDAELPGELGLVGASLEESYDARDDGIVPAIRSQGSTSLCWSYSTLACMEINLIKNGLASTNIDLSEYHLGFYSYYSGSDLLGNSGTAKSTCASSSGYVATGGNQYMAALALMNWKGVVDDSGIFSSKLSTSYADNATYAYTYDSYHMGNWYQIPTTSTDVMKVAIKAYGAISINYYSSTNSNYYNSQTAAQYCNSSRHSADHAVTIIGWDDNFSRSNFSTQPSSDGAWLVRNSWGDAWGEEGYFWLSYEDATIYEWAYAFEGADVEAYDNNYQYDHSTYGSYVSAVSAANVFTACGNGDKQEILEAVGVDLGGSGTSYSLQIYRNPTDSTDPTSGEPLLTTAQTGTTEYAGFYVIPLEKTITLSPGDVFAVVFDLSRESGTAAVGVEIKYSDTAINSNYDIEAGQSYLATSAGSWKDVAGSSGNLKIKAYTTDTDSEAVACESISVSASQTTVDVGGTVKCTVAFTPDNDSVSKSVTWSSSDTSVATVTGSGVVTGVSAGTVRITATTRTGARTASVELTVVQSVTSVSFSYNQSYYYVGETYAATVSVLPTNAADRTLTWTSSDETVATVDSEGTLTIRGVGSATITAAAVNGVSASRTIRTKQPYVNSVSFTYNTSTFYVGETYAATVTITPSTASLSLLTWTSSNEAVATVDSNGTLTILSAGTTMIKAAAPSGASSMRSVSTSEKVLLNGWVTIDGTDYWYEDDVRQGYDPDDPNYRGKEIYDPDSDAWYWLDNVQDGAKAVSKDVYQESGAGLWADHIVLDADGNIDQDASWGKWVRYDANGHMVKGWQTTDAGTYYFDLTYGTMAKGYATIDGIEYYFNPDTGILERVVGTAPEGNGWKNSDGNDYWYENGVRQGYSKDTSYRGKEIYDPGTDAWYWLDNVDGGKKATGKDVYQESQADDAGTMGKWVRYDAEGHMIKGWDTNENGTYYFDLIYGTMAKGDVTIDGKEYHFNETTGVLE